MTTVVNMRHEPYDVYIGRGSPWGNPFVIGPDGSRQEVIERYEFYMRLRLTREKSLVASLLGLKGKRLGCFCRPKACHGDVLVRLIDEVSSGLSLDNL